MLVAMPGHKNLAEAVQWFAAWVIGIVLLGLLIFAGFMAVKASNAEGKMSESNPTGVSPSHSIRPEPVSLSESIRKIDWFQFEKLIAHLYTSQGYVVTRKGGANPDGGIDLILEKDGERIAVQCKHWKAWKVGVAKLRELLGALSDTGISKGIIVTVSGYTIDAKDFANRNKIEIVDSEQIYSMVASAGGMENSTIRELFADDRKVCPKCESEMILRTARRGLNAGGKFWGCSRYPRCNFILKI
jgi:restriction system protein